MSKKSIIEIKKEVSRGIAISKYDARRLFAASEVESKNNIYTKLTGHTKKNISGKKTRPTSFKASEHKKYLISLVSFGWKSIFDTKLLKEILDTAMAIGNYSTATQIRKRLA